MRDTSTSSSRRSPPSSLPSYVTAQAPSPPPTPPPSTTAPALSFSVTAPSLRNTVLTPASLLASAATPTQLWIPSISLWPQPRPCRWLLSVQASLRTRSLSGNSMRRSQELFWRTRRSWVLRVPRLTLLVELSPLVMLWEALDQGFSRRYCTS